MNITFIGNITFTNSTIKMNMVMLTLHRGGGRRRQKREASILTQVYWKGFTIPPMSWFFSEGIMELTPSHFMSSLLKTFQSWIPLWTLYRHPTYHRQRRFHPNRRANMKFGTGCSDQV
jgi:hypothetical protein